VPLEGRSNRMSKRRRRGKDHGIWLCRSCGRLIEADPKKFTVELLMVVAVHLAFVDGIGGAVAAPPLVAYARGCRFSGSIQSSLRLSPLIRTPHV